MDTWICGTVVDETNQSDSVSPTHLRFSPLLMASSLDAGADTRPPSALVSVLFELWQI